MGIRKTVEEQMVVPGDRDGWLGLCERSLKSQKFKKICVNRALGQVQGDYKQLVGTIWGDIIITLTPEGPNTRLTVRATANVDNAYAHLSSPGAKMIKKFKVGLGPLETPIAAAGVVASIPVTDQLERLVAMRGDGSLTDAEFQSAKKQLLN